MADPLQDSINWEFSRPFQTGETRYGVKDGIYYAQFVPDNKVFTNFNPVRVIDEKVYKAAKNLSTAFKKFNTPNRQ